MAEIKDKLITTESLKYVHDSLSGDIIGTRTTLSRLDTISIEGVGKYPLDLIDFEIGAISGDTGEETESNVYWRFTKSIPTRCITSITVPNGYILRLYYYNSDGTYTGSVHNLSSSNGTVPYRQWSYQKYDYVRFLVLKTTYQAFSLTQAELDAYSIIVQPYAKDSIRIYNSFSDLSVDYSLRNGDICKVKDETGAEYIISNTVIDSSSVSIVNELYATPRGISLTDAEKQDIVAFVLAALPRAEEAEF